MIESRRGIYGEEVERIVMVGSSTRAAEMKVSRNSVGKVDTVEWVILGKKRPVEKRKYDIDGQVRFQYYCSRDFRTSSTDPHSS